MDSVNRRNSGNGARENTPDAPPESPPQSTPRSSWRSNAPPTPIGQASLSHVIETVKSPREAKFSTHREGPSAPLQLVVGDQYQGLEKQHKRETGATPSLLGPSLAFRPLRSPRSSDPHAPGAEAEPTHQQIAESNRHAKDAVRKKYASAYKALFADPKEEQGLERRIFLLCHGENRFAEETLVKVAAITREHQRFCIRRLVQTLAPFVEAKVGEMEPEKLDSLVAVLEAPLEQCIKSWNLLKSDDHVGHEAVSRQLRDAVNSAVADHYPTEYLAYYRLSLDIWRALAHQLKDELSLTQDKASKGILRTDSDATKALASALLPCSATLTKPLIATIGFYLESDDSYVNLTQTLQLNEAGAPTMGLEPWREFVLPLMSHIRRFLLVAEFSEPLRATTNTLCRLVHKEAERAVGDEENPDNVSRVKALKDATQLSIVKIMFLRLIVPHVVSAGNDAMKMRAERKIYLLAAHLMKMMIDGPRSLPRQQRSETLDLILLETSLIVEARLKTMMTEIAYPFGDDFLRYGPPSDERSAPRIIDSSQDTSEATATTSFTHGPPSLGKPEEGEGVAAPPVGEEPTLDASSAPATGNRPMSGIAGDRTARTPIGRGDRLTQRKPLLVRTEKRARLSSLRPSGQGRASSGHERASSDTSSLFIPGSAATTLRRQRTDDESKPMPILATEPVSPRSKLTSRSPLGSPRREASQKSAPVSKKAREQAKKRYAGAFPQFFASKETSRVLDQRILALPPTGAKAVISSQAIEREYQRVCIYGLVMEQAPFVPDITAGELDALLKRLEGPLERYIIGLSKAQHDGERAQARALLNDAVQSAVAVMFPERHLTFHALKSATWPSLVDQLKEELEFTQACLKVGIFRQGGSTPIKELSSALQPCGAPLAAQVIDVIQVFLEGANYAELMKGVPLSSTGAPIERSDVWDKFMTSVLLEAKAVLLSLKIPEIFKQTAAQLFPVIDQQVQLELGRLDEADKEAADEKSKKANGERRRLILELQPRAKLSIVQQMFLRLVVPQVAAPERDPTTPEAERPVYKKVAAALLTMINLVEKPTKGQLSQEVDQLVFTMTPDVRSWLEGIVAEIEATEVSE
jgi:hypothetical protein